MPKDDGITLEELEALASNLLSKRAKAREDLARLIAVYAKVLRAVDSDAFVRCPLEYSDTIGKPTVQEFKDFGGEPAIKIADIAWDAVSTTSTNTSSEYHWRAALKDPGLYIAADGGLLGAGVEGSGRRRSTGYGPVDSGVKITFEWRRLGSNEFRTEQLQTAESRLRELAFPYVSDLFFRTKQTGLPEASG